MISFKQILTEVNTEYVYSTDAGELAAALDRLDGLLAQKALNDANRADAEALRMRLTCKLYLLRYLDGFDDKAEAELKSFIAANAPIAEQKGYGKSGAVMQFTLRFLSVVSHFAAVKNEITALSRSDGVVVKSGRSLLEQADKLIADIAGLDAVSPFGDNVEFPDVKTELGEQMRSWRQGVVAAYTRALEHTVPHKTLDYAKYDYFPVPEYDEGGKADAIVLNTPFPDEARLYAAHIVPADIDLVEFDAGVAGVADILAYAESKGCAAFISHAEMLPDGEKKALLRGAMKAGKNGVKIFIADCECTLYDEAMLIAAEDSECSPLDISVAYITMPSFNATCDELKTLGMGTDFDCREALKAMPFLGFMGLNEIVRPEHMRDWAARGKKISAGNAAAAKRYLSRLKSSMLFIDDGWGEFKGGAAFTDDIDGFDYDDIAELDVKDVHSIMDSGATVFGLCGMAARFCTTGTGDVTEWGKLEREEMQRRVELAVNLVYKILRVPVKPVVEILDELENDSAGGLCCDGGKRIVFKFSCCRDVQWMRDAIVHESFHSLQSKLTAGNWTQWYYDNMGITYGRVCKWKETRETKYNSNTKSDIYKVHMYEADAYAFEVDCRRGMEYYWSTVDFS